MFKNENCNPRYCCPCNNIYDEYDEYECDSDDMDDIEAEEAKLKEMLLGSYCEMWGAKYGGAFVTADGENVFIKKVVYHKPKVTILWNDGTKSVASCTGADADHFCFESGLNIAINNRLYGYATMNQLYDDWLPDRYTDEDVDLNDLYEVTISDVRKHYKLKYAIEDKLADLCVENGMKEYLENKGYIVTKKK